MCKLYFYVAWPSMDPEKTHGSAGHTYVKGRDETEQYHQYRAFCIEVLGQVGDISFKPRANRIVCSLFRRFVQTRKRKQPGVKDLKHWNFGHVLWHIDKHESCKSDLMPVER
jgi:hypothetical protein